MMTVIFKPVAQNTIIRPLAQAVSLVRAGETVTYIDSADKKEKNVSYEDLFYLDLKTIIKGRQVPVEANLVTFWAKHSSVQVLVLVNGVTVKVTSNTTVQQAMSQFHRKLSAQNRITEMIFPTRQRNS